VYKVLYYYFRFPFFITLYFQNLGSKSTLLFSLFQIKKKRMFSDKKKKNSDRSEMKKRYLGNTVAESYFRLNKLQSLRPLL